MKKKHIVNRGKNKGRQYIQWVVAQTETTFGGRIREITETNLITNGNWINTRIYWKGKDK